MPRGQPHQLPTAIEGHLEKFQNWLDLADTSIQTYTTCLRTFYERSGRDTVIPHTDFTERQIAIIADDISQHTTSESMKAALKKYFDWLQERTPHLRDERTILFLKNKVESVNPNVSHSNIAEKVVSSEKIRSLCQQVPENMRKDQREARLFLQFMYDTATRFSGTNWLEWQDVWREEYAGDEIGDTEIVIHSDRSKSRDTGVVEIMPGTLRLLRQHEKQVSPTDAGEQVFFPDMTDNSAYQKIYRNMKSVAQDIGIPDVSPHWFRHSRLTHLGMEMLEDEKSYPEIKERLRQYGRHRSGETTEIYIKILKERRSERVSKYSPVSWSKYR